MSQKRYKKQLSSLDNAASLTDHELREALKSYGQSPGPITDSTRNLYRKKLASLLDESGGISDDINNQTTSNSSNKSRLQSQEPKPLPVKESLDAVGDDDDDTSDEDYSVDEESLNDEEELTVDDEEEEDEDGDEEEEEDAEELINELDDDVKLSSTTSELSTSIVSGPEAVANRISRSILTFLITFFIAIFSSYLYSTINYKQFINLQPYKNITKLLLVLIAFSPIGYIIYKTFRFYKRRRDEEGQRVCQLVNDALEILQSPDNPKGMMPVLHIRDTLLTPAERKTKKMINLWNKAVKFMEEHESRVKVELVNIAGEDFRAWKWIGSRKP